MKENMLSGQISITRPSSNMDDVNYIRIEVVDDNSRSRFLDMHIDYAAFAQALTGLSYMPVKFTFRNAENVGKYIEKKDLIIDIDKYHLDQKEADEIIDRYTPEGWYASHYVGSQNSFFTKKDKYYLKTYIYRYVDNNPNEEKENG